MPYQIDTYPNAYRVGSPYELYGDPDMYLKWRGPIREAARIQVLEMLAPVYGEILTANGFALDDALNKSKMWRFAYGSGAAGSHTIHGQNLFDLAEVFEASLNMTAIHEQSDYAMVEKMRQFVSKAQQTVNAGLTAFSEVTDLVIPENVAPVVTTPPLVVGEQKTGWFIPLSLIVAAVSLLG